MAPIVLLLPDVTVKNICRLLVTTSVVSKHFMLGHISASPNVKLDIDEFVHSVWPLVPRILLQY